MRSWSISVGRLFGVDVRIHLTFFILPMFIFWTEYAAHQGAANGPRDMALAGIILACVAAHESGHMFAARRFGLIPKAVILLPLTGVSMNADFHLDAYLLGVVAPTKDALDEVVATVGRTVIFEGQVRTMCLD